MKRNREEKILTETYHDNLTVYRKVPLKNPDTGETTESEVIVYENIRCALSNSSNNTPQKQEFYHEKQMNAVLFTEPYVFMIENDRVEILTETRQFFEGVTGRTFPYVSHGETPVSLEGMT